MEAVLNGKMYYDCAASHLPLPIVHGTVVFFLLFAGKFTVYDKSGCDCFVLFIDLTRRTGDDFTVTTPLEKEYSVRVMYWCSPYLFYIPSCVQTEAYE